MRIGSSRKNIIIII